MAGLGHSRGIRRAADPGRARVGAIPHSAEGGFTLVQIMMIVVVTAIMLIVMVQTVNEANSPPIRTREAVIRADLYQMRSCIDQHLADKGYYPASLKALVDNGYLRYLPNDPFTRTVESAWEELYAEPNEFEPLEDGSGNGTQVVDVRYADTARVGLDGTQISEW